MRLLQEWAPINDSRPAHALKFIRIVEREWVSYCLVLLCTSETREENLANDDDNAMNNYSESARALGVEPTIVSHTKGLCVIYLSVINSPARHL